jgi:hypothetical protein
MVTASSARTGTDAQRAAVRSARSHKPYDRLQILDKADIKPSNSSDKNRRLGRRRE